MALHGADSNETNNFPSTVPELIKILPKRETTLHIRMGDSPNTISNQSTPSSSSSSSSNNNNRHQNHHSHNHRHNNTNSSKNGSNSSNNNNSINSPCYHTLRYDFKPASINSEEPATLELTQNGQVTIKAPNVGGSVSSQTVFRGQKRPHVKECLLVIDHSTGEMVLQKLTDNITVKATRSIGAGGGGGATLSLGNGSGNSSISTPAIAASTTTIANMTSTTNSITNTTMSQIVKMDGPQLSEESSSSDDSSDTSSSSSSSSSSNSGNSSPNNEGFTF